MTNNFYKLKFNKDLKKEVAALIQETAAIMNS